MDAVLCEAGELTRIATPRLPIRPRGTGDFLTGLIAAQLAKGVPVEPALRRAVGQVYAILKRTMADRADEMTIIGMNLKGAYNEHDDCT